MAGTGTKLPEVVKGYTEFRVEDKIVAVPYCIAADYDNNLYGTGRTPRYKNYGGKGSPEQILKALHAATAKHEFDLKAAQPEGISRFMIQQGIGVDCSGFVYNVLDTYLKANQRPSLNRLVLRANNPFGRLERLVLRQFWVRRCNANTLTSSFNTVKISKAKDVRPGDLLRLTPTGWHGKHIAVIIAATPKQITYAHSSEYTKTQGTHTATINIRNPEVDLEDQDWQETTLAGEDYGEFSYKTSQGDSVRRLRFLTEQQ